MAKFKPWLKLWVEWLDDLKMLSLSLAEQGVWWRLCSLAQKCAADGALVKDNGAPLSLNEIASTLRITTKTDRKAFDSMIQKMTDQGSLHWNSNALVITHFKDRQARTTSQTTEDVRDRVRRWREKQLASKEKESSKEKETLEGEPEAEAEADNSLHIPLHSNVSSVTRNGKRVTAESVLAKISICHEENFGIITPILAEKFREFVENYHGPIEWIKEAFAEAVTHNARKWAYVEAILDRWQREGREKNGRGVGPGRGAPAHRQDPHAAARAAGWQVGGEDEGGDGNRDQD